MLIKNIRELLQVREAGNEDSFPLRGKYLSNLPSLQNAWLLLDGDQIADYGTMDNCPDYKGECIDASGKTVLPSWVDSHTHLVFAGSREEEFELRLKGASYEEIAEAGGGILNSARKLQKSSEEELFKAAWRRLQEVIELGTGAIEIKSGYGLSVEGELKMLRVIQRLKKESPIPVKVSFLGAHSYPAEFKQNHEAYIQQIIEEMLPVIGAEQLADYIDVFCEKVAFSAEETERIVKAGKKYGLRPKIHTNQFNSMGGIELSIANEALSVDHLEVVNAKEIELLGNAATIATLLPSAPFFLNDPYQPARDLIDGNAAIALASDYNPGSSPSGNMNLVLSLACIKLRMTPQEALNAATINGACALELEKQVGSISRGKKANVIITKAIPSLAYLPYAFGSRLIDTVLVNGKVI